MDGTGNIKSPSSQSALSYMHRVLRKSSERPASKLLQAAEQTLMEKVTVADYNAMALVASAETNKHTNQKNRRGRIQQYLGSPHVLQQGGPQRWLVIVIFSIVMIKIK